MQSLIINGRINIIETITIILNKLKNKYKIKKIFMNLIHQLNKLDNINLTNIKKLFNSISNDEYIQLSNILTHINNNIEISKILLLFPINKQIIILNQYPILYIVEIFETMTNFQVALILNKYSNYEIYKIDYLYNRSIIDKIKSGKIKDILNNSNNNICNKIVNKLVLYKLQKIFLSMNRD